MTRLNDFLFHIERAVASFFCVLMFVIVIAEVAWRSFLGTTVLVGVQEFAVWSYIWMVLIACAAVSYKNSHIKVDYFMSRFCPPKMQNSIEMVMTVILALSFALVIITGYPFAMKQWQQYTTSANVPKTFVFLSVPVAFSFMLIHCLVRIKTIFGKVFSAQSRKDD